MSRIKDIVDKLLNKTVVISKRREDSKDPQDTKESLSFRICEIEIYWYSPKHQDEYAHKSKEQLLPDRWYFHRPTLTSSSYKEGTFKGLDITMGNNKDRYIGILIRSLLNLKTNEFIEGPCNCVKALIAPYQKVSDYLKEEKELPLSVYTDPYLYLQNYDLVREDIYSGKRIGLSEKYPMWRNKKYRFLTHKNKIKKQKSNLVFTIAK